MSKNNSNGTLAAAGGVIKTGGFAARLFAYAVYYIPITLVYVWIMIMSKAGGAINLSFLADFIPETEATSALVILIIFLLPPVLPFLFIERSVRKFRRKNGLSVYKNIEGELAQMEVNERVAKEHKAYVNNGLVKEVAVDKSDVGYWFGLLEKGAITKEEFEAKKKELL